MFFIGMVIGWLIGLWTLDKYYRSTCKIAVDAIVNQYREALKDANL